MPKKFPITGSVGFALLHLAANILNKNYKVITGTFVQPIKLIILIIHSNALVLINK